MNGPVDKSLVTDYPSNTWLGSGKTRNMKRKAEAASLGPPSNSVEGEEELLNQSIDNFHRNLISQVIDRWRDKSQNPKKDDLAEVIRERWTTKLESKLGYSLHTDVVESANEETNGFLPVPRSSAILSLLLPPPRRQPGLPGYPQVKVQIKLPSLREKQVNTLRENPTQSSKPKSYPDDSEHTEKLIPTKRRKVLREDNVPAINGPAVIAGMQVFLDLNGLPDTEDFQAFRDWYEEGQGNDIVRGRIIQILKEQVISGATATMHTKIKCRFKDGYELLFPWPSKFVSLTSSHFGQPFLTTSTDDIATSNNVQEISNPDQVISNQSENITMSSGERMARDTSSGNNCVQEIINGWLEDDFGEITNLLDIPWDAGITIADVNTASTEIAVPQQSSAVPKNIQPFVDELPKVLLSTGEVVKQDVLDGVERYFEKLTAKKPSIKVSPLRRGKVDSSAFLIAPVPQPVDSDIVHLHPDDDPLVPCPDPEVTLIGKVPKVRGYFTM